MGLLYTILFSNENKGAEKDMHEIYLTGYYILAFTPMLGCITSPDKQKQQSIRKFPARLEND